MISPTKSGPVGRRLRATLGQPTVAAQFLAAGFGAGLGVVGLGWALTGGTAPIAVALGGGAFAAGCVIAWIGMRAHYPHAGLGLCNLVTLLRLMLAMVLFIAWLAPPVDPWAIFALAALAFGLDGLDGPLARSAGKVSAFGARFDMEVDSALALVLALLAAQAGAVGAVVLVLGLPRYVFWAAQRPCPWLDGELPPRFSRKLVCVAQISVLLLALWPGVDPVLARVALGLAVAGLAWSFWRDVRWLWRTR